MSNFTNIYSKLILIFCLNVMSLFSFSQGRYAFCNEYKAGEYAIGKLQSSQSSILLSNNCVTCKYNIDKSGFGDTVFPYPIDTTKTYFSEALHYIDSVAEHFDVTFISEDHDLASHRIFTKELAKLLYLKGYRILMEEAFLTNGHDTFKVDFPYSNRQVIPLGVDPLYYELSSKASDVGYTLYAFNECLDHTCLPLDTIALSDTLRFISIRGSKDEYVKYRYDTAGNLLEMIDTRKQTENTKYAENILKIMKSHPGQKAVVIMGHTHVWKRPRDCAGYLLSHSSLRVLSIDQDWVEEKSVSKYENPFYRYAIRHIDNPSIVIDSVGAPFPVIPYGSRIFGQKGAVDMSIIHPRTSYIHHRPDWLINDTDRVTTPLDKRICKIKRPTLIIVYNYDDYKKYGDKAIAVDVLEVDDRKEENVLSIMKHRKQIVTYRTYKGKPHSYILTNK